MSRNIPLITVDLRSEHDVVLVRQRACLVGFDSQDRSHVATAVSEIARNACQYASVGKAEFTLDQNPPTALLINVSDAGPGIPDLALVLGGRYISKTGRGQGLLGTKRLMDRVEIDSKPDQGTRVSLNKDLPRRGLASRRLDVNLIASELARMSSRGVLALYSEVDEKAQQLQRANDLKTSFMANMGHEFRTPLSSIMFRPLLLSSEVVLQFDEEPGISPLQTDEGKVAQILRNFISNALKFTERGSVRVAARSGSDGIVRFTVDDTGIGIATEDRERVFTEFGQVQGSHQRGVKGTGLGLPLARKLAQLLGGDVEVQSTPGSGSTFTAWIPSRFQEESGVGNANKSAKVSAPHQVTSHG